MMMVIICIKRKEKMSLQEYDKNEGREENVALKGEMGMKKLFF